MRKKTKTTLEEYYRIKVDREIECVFLFSLILKNKNKTHVNHPQSITSFTKSTNSNRNCHCHHSI